MAPDRDLLTTGIRSPVPRAGAGHVRGIAAADRSSAGSRRHAGRDGPAPRHHPRTGADVFDLFLAAQMQCHGIADICTYNLADFALPGIRALAPAQVPQTART